MAGTATVDPDGVDQAEAEKPAPKTRAKAAESEDKPELSEADQKLIDFASRPESEQNRIVRDVARQAVISPQTGAIDTPNDVDLVDFEHRFSHRAPEGYVPPVFPHPQVN